MAKQKQQQKSKPLTLEEQYIEIATWELPYIDETVDLSQPEVNLQSEQVKTFVTYGVPPGL